MKPIVWVTGGSRGIGAATVKRLYADGYRVAFSYCENHSAAQQITESCPGVVAVCGDVSDASSVADMYNEICRQLGEPEILVCNAGIALPQQLLTDTNNEQLSRVLAVNTLGPLLCCRQAIPAMVQNKCGCIVTISSMWGQIGGSCEVAYSASKGGVIAMTKALAKELGPSNIRVNCVCPGVIDTDMNAHLTADDRSALAEETPLQRLGDSEEVADLIAYLCSDQSSFITGQIIGVNGGLVIE